MNGTNYEVPHCGAFSTPHSHPSWAQIFPSGSCFQPTEIAETVGISFEKVYDILTNELGMKKLSTRWVPRRLTQNQKQSEVQIVANLSFRLHQIFISTISSTFPWWTEILFK